MKHQKGSYILDNKIIRQYNGKKNMPAAKHVQAIRGIA